MKLCALALDYDGTVAEDGAVDEDVRAALREVRDRGIAVVLATGRILDDLRAVAGDLAFADAIVAENGAVVALPGAPPRMLAREASPAFARALAARGISSRMGRCVVEGAAADAARMLDVVRALRLPLVLAFNRSRVMALPSGICKSAGLREVLRAFRLSPRNTLAIGDAENDHDLLDACEYGAAVAWGSVALKDSADGVVPGERPRDLAPYLRRLAAGARLPEPRAPRRSVALGRAADGREVALAVRGRNVLVAGDPRSGKSWAAGLFSEQLVLLGYSICIVDPEGDYTPLEALPGVVALGGVVPLPPVEEITRLLHHADLSVVVDLSRLAHDAKAGYLRALLPHLARFRQRTGFPHRVLVDEAHYFLDRPDATRFFDLERGGYALVTYRVSELHPPLLRTVEAVVMTHTSDPREVATLAAVAGREGDETWPALLRDLAIDEAALVRATAGEGAHVERFRLAPRVTAHVRHRAKYRDVPLPRERAFVFTRSGTPSGPPACTLRAFVEGLSRAPRDAVEDHARRGDFSRWIAGVFGDHPLADEVRELELRHRRGELLDLPTALSECVSLRYEVARAAGP